MRIRRSVIEKIVREELGAHLRGLLGEGPKSPGVEDAIEDNGEKKEEKPQKKAPAPPKGEKKADPDKGGKDPKELPIEKEPADDKLEEPDEEDATEVTGGKISKELVGKTIQSITMEPKSKVMPGAQEIVIQFDQIPDPLRILIGKTGVVKFYYKGLHNEV